jgi:putrescine transport system permease protein
VRASKQAKPGLVALIPGFWQALFFLAPFLIILGVSFAETLIGVPPFSAPLTIEGGLPHFDLHLDNYARLGEDALYLEALGNSLLFAGGAALLTLALGYPMAYAIARAPRRWHHPLLLLVMLPFWTSFLIRVYAWMGLLKPNGVINNLLTELGVIAAPLPLLNNAFAVELGLVYSYLPFMVLPLFATLESLDPALIEAAQDLGCRPLFAFLRVTLPLSLPGILAGLLLVFVPAVGEFVIPDLLGGPGTLMIGKVVWDEFFTNHDWPMAAAVAVAMLALFAAPMAALQAWRRRMAVA